MLDRNLILLFAAICLLISILVGATTYNSKQKQRTMAEMVAAGADPQAAACAVDGVNSINQQICATLANRNK